MKNFTLNAAVAALGLAALLNFGCSKTEKKAEAPEANDPTFQALVVGLRQDETKQVNVNGTVYKVTGVLVSSGKNTDYTKVCFTGRFEQPISSGETEPKPQAPGAIAKAFTVQSCVNGALRDFTPAK